MTTRVAKLPAFARLVWKRSSRALPTWVKSSAVRPPETVMIRLTHRCNFACFFCGQRGTSGVYRAFPHASHSEELGTEQWKRFISEVSSFKPYIYFTGGEPLLRQDLAALVEHASAHHLLTHINTNGSHMPAHAEELIEAGVDFVHFSLDSLAESGHSTTGVTNGFEMSMAGLKALVAARRKAGSRFPVIQVFCTIHQLNQDRLYDIAQAVDRTGADIFVLCFPVFTTAALEQQTAEEYRRLFGISPVYWKGFVRDMSGIDCGVIEHQIRRIRSGCLRLTYRQVPPVSMKVDVRDHFGCPDKVHGGRKACPLIRSVAVVLPNGDVATCWDHPDYIVGNIHSAALLDLWNNERYRQFRQVLTRHLFPSCARCAGLYY